VLAFGAARAPIAGASSHPRTSPPAIASMVALAPTPPMGWNPWYEFGCGINEQIVEQTAQAIVSSGLAADGYQYVNLDDCWMAPQRDGNGNLQANPATFPDGIASLASFVHALGLKLGIYLDAGTHTCMGLPGSASYYAQDAATVASWGVDYIKFDYCYTGLVAPEPLYAQMHDALESLGRPVVLSVADDGFRRPWDWAPGIASLWRTTNDYTAYGAKSGHWWRAVLKIAGLNAGLYRYARPGAWNDPDVLLTGTGLLTVPQERSQFSLWSMMAAPLLIDGDVREMSPATASILMNREVIAVDQDPAGRQGARILYRRSRQVWVRRLAGGSHALLFLNTGGRAESFAIGAARVGLAHTRYVLRDLWLHRTRVSSAAVIRVRVRRDDVVMLRIRRAPKRHRRHRRH